MENPKTETRSTLAIYITFISVLGITTLSIVVIILNKNFTETVFSSVLPLFGTWVGTVLAFYFSRENFETAATRTQELVERLSPEERLRSTLVTIAMTTDFYSIYENIEEPIQTTQRYNNHREEEGKYIFN